MDVSKEYFSYKLNDKSIPAAIEEKFNIVDNSILKKLREIVFGKNIRVMTSGAASLAPEMAQFFMAIGRPIYEAYGLTEMISVSMNRPNKQKVSTVGVPMPHCSIELASDGEILVKSPGMFPGYFMNPEADKEIFDANREWLCTGDLGAIDEEGFLRIIGRKKELIITSTGKNIVPTKIEGQINSHDCISQSMLVGEGKSYCTALLTLNPAEVLHAFPVLGEGLSDDEKKQVKSGVCSEEINDSFIADADFSNAIQKHIDSVNAELNRTEQIKKFKILNRDFSMELNEVTPTMKLKRKVIVDTFQDIIAELYS